ncbi:RluA family pseudouridine synthase [Hazenella coriacea]|uniref:Pseudouridine synthase n=1 Tax=Hazenella coriacea TaxID=1179467 RepID=A0A4R3LF41_9BACL|nr:RluA family pseudouridine synthase [Hazenella coriacea]TCS96984.1 tRNA pseudouridine32 synthase/23S rRNA pseudouridine746 synthase/23S rRNA pseudouridine1911/1915/1917 synthase [Hazenella coriacea]
MKKRYDEWITFTITPEWDQATVVEVLKGPLMVSNRMINRLTRRKGIRLNGRTPFLKKQVRLGDRIQVAIRPKEQSELPPQSVPFEVIFEDTDLMVVNKPAGILVHPVREKDTHTLAHGIIYHWQQQGVTGIARPVHRLDQYTSGLILVAKNAYMHQLLDRQLRENRISRQYQAFVAGSLQDNEGVIQLPIGRDPHHPTRRMVKQSGDDAITHYRLLKQRNDISFVQVELETGRTHQIRVHFSHLGHPLLGDRLYGGDSTWITRQALHSASLSLIHPLSQQQMSFSADLPEDLERVYRQLVH